MIISDFCELRRINTYLCGVYVMILAHLQGEFLIGFVWQKTINIM